MDVCGCLHFVQCHYKIRECVKIEIFEGVSPRVAKGLCVTRDKG